MKDTKDLPQTVRYDLLANAIAEALLSEASLDLHSDIEPDNLPSKGELIVALRTVVPFMATVTLSGKSSDNLDGHFLTVASENQVHMHVHPAEREGQKGVQIGFHAGALSDAEALELLELAVGKLRERVQAQDSERSVH
jgi:hypothetical protein